jgi:hypothetical protein
VNPDLLIFLRLWTGNLLPEEAGETEIQRVLERLRNDANFRSECVEELALLGALKIEQAPAPRWLELADALQITGAEDSQKSSPEFAQWVMKEVEAVPIRPQEKNPWGRRSLLAVAAVFAVFLGICFWQFRGLPVEIVQVSESAGVDWLSGDQVRLRRLVWIRGTVACRLPSGTVLSIEGPAELEFRSAMEVRLHSGRVTADVGEHGKGFVIETPQTRVVDLGTVFGVDASEAARTDVVVFKGQVQVYDRETASDGILLNKGEGIRIQKNRRSSRIVSVSDTDASGAWSGRENSQESCTVRTVRDSMVVDDKAAARWPSLRNFYRIVPGGMRNGALAFSDSNDVWQDVPPGMIGADQVRTFSVDGFNWWMNLTLDLRRPCRVFVLLDKRNPAPSWVRREFRETGETLTLDFKPPQAGGKVARQLPYSVWERTVTAPGELILGPPYENPPEDRKSFQPNRMFGVAVKAVP